MNTDKEILIGENVLLFRLCGEWYLNARRAGDTVAIDLKEMNEQQALRVARSRAAFYRSPVPAGHEFHELGTLITYYNDYEREHLSRTVRAFEKRVLVGFDRFMDVRYDHCVLAVAVSPDDIEAFQAHLIRRRYAKSVIARCIKVVADFMDHILRAGDILKSPCAGMSRRRAA